jgi:hypothetical protein
MIARTLYDKLFDSHVVRTERTERRSSTSIGISCTR